MRNFDKLSKSLFPERDAAFGERRREFLGYAGKGAVGLAGLYALSKIPISYEQTNTIPKLRYNPTIDQLYSDFSLQQQMLAVDLKLNSTSPIAGMVGIGLDSSNIDYVFAHTTEKQNISEVAEITIDKNPLVQSGVNSIDEDDFLILYSWNTEQNMKETRFSIGPSNNAPAFTSWHRSKLPDGFNWDARFTKSYFNPINNQNVFVAQIPYSSMGNSGEKFGMSVSISPPSILSGGPINSIGYPYDSADFIAKSWGVFDTAIPVPEFHFPGVIALGSIALLSFLSWRKSRIRKNIWSAPNR